MKINQIINGAILVAMVSCQQPKSVEEDVSSGSPGLITLSQGQSDNIGLKLGKIDSVKIRQKVQVNGYVDVPPEGRASVTTYKAGYVKEVLLLVGDKVKKGQQLAVLEHPDYVKLQQDYMDLSGRLSYLKSEYERQQSLFADKITAEKNLLKAESEYKSSLAQFKGLKEELKMLGLSTSQVNQGKISSTIRINSPINGHVTEVNCTVGKYMPASAEMFEIVDPDHLHMELSVFEQDVIKIKIGQPVIANIPNVGMGEIKGEVFLVGKTLENESRSVRVHAHFEGNTDGVLPGMYLEAQIITEEVKVLALPMGTVVKDGENRYVFIQVAGDDGQPGYKREQVEVGVADENWIEIKNPAKIKGKQVVVKGAYSLSGFEGV